MADREPPLRLEVDELRLDEEWAGHAEQAYQWMVYAAHQNRKLDIAKQRAELAKLRLARVAAGLGREMRARPGRFGLSKSTDASIAEAVRCHPDYKAAEEELVIAQGALADASADLRLAEAAVSALKDRKHALQKMVELLLSGYLGTPVSRPRREISDNEKGGVRKGRVRKDD